MSFLHILSYFTVIVFLYGVINRVLKISNAPIHLRWELYPVPHEKGKAGYGGSRLEELDWWEKNQEKDYLGEIFVMLKEIILLKGVWEQNKSLWFGSFPFHFAIYFLFLLVGFSSLGAILLLSGVGPLSEYWIYHQVIFNISGWLCSVLGVMGSVRLIFSRITDKGLSKYSTPSHYFNIILLGGVFLSLFFIMIYNPYFFITSIQLHKRLYTLGVLPQFSIMESIHIYLFIFFMLYLPFTHMTHFFTKYFTYHKVRWEDTSIHGNEKLKARLMEQFNYKISWSAPHISPDGMKTWLAVATEEQSKEVKK